MLTQDYQKDEFSAVPKVVTSKPKYKDPYGSTSEYYPVNIMYDKRIVRGTNYGSNIISAGSKSEDAFMEKKRQQQMISKRRQQQAAEQYTRREIPTPEPITGRQNLDVQTDQFVEELTDKAPCYEIGSQTTFKMEEPEMDFSIPTKTGNDFCAQTEDGDLFIFDDDVEPILQVLCGKTLEHAKMEVLEEEELKYMREEQKHFKKLREEEIAEAQKLESIELRKKQEIERRKQQQKVKKLEKIAAHKKFTCRQIAKKFFAPMTSHVMTSLKERGAMIKEFDIKLTENYVPWLYLKMQEFMIEDQIHEENENKLVKDVMKIEEMGHRSMMEKEHKRLEDEKIAAEKTHQEKLDEKE
jgi:radial spoke head protein 3